MLRENNEEKEKHDGQEEISEMLLKGGLSALIELTGLYGHCKVPIFVDQETTLSLLPKAIGSGTQSS